ncbi:hypothetical protein NQZ68_000794 [Dissostichus eleginoides]|nr:hypothetical protein NQZ68_000794 [Dissostichus eleginoides]
MRAHVSCLAGRQCNLFQTNYGSRINEGILQKHRGLRCLECGQRPGAEKELSSREKHKESPAIVSISLTS